MLQLVGSEEAEPKLVCSEGEGGCQTVLYRVECLRSGAERDEICLSFLYRGTSKCSEIKGFRGSLSWVSQTFYL